MSPPAAPDRSHAAAQRLRVKLVDGDGALQLGQQRGQAAEVVAVAVGDQDQGKRAELDAQRAQRGNEAPVRAARARIDKDIFLSPNQEGENEAERDGNHRRLHENDDTPRASALQQPRAVSGSRRAGARWALSAVGSLAAPVCIRRYPDDRLEIPDEMGLVVVTKVEGSSPH